ncbi:hypothetical protein LG324_13850 [Phycicoccus jejuensis]|uniref:hypothetical protein n=1 Tax=Phycicoccus TaxID=367298 RepID=UPI000AB64558|nr:MULTISPECIES: hypothetical protein [Phycicoccus]GIL34155.1 hypothetical protein PDTK01_02320 [Phycicoccus sp. DTK01]
MTPDPLAPATVTDEALADRLARVVLGPVEAQEAPDTLALVARSASAHAATRDLLQQAVAAARADGRSWAAVGEVLGLSRQAAQQRFGGVVDDGPTEAQERWLGPVTAFDEMPELELAGRQGWRTVGAGMLRHRMVRTPTQWEHRRVLWSRPAAAYEGDGWVVAVRAFPWLYLVRDTGRPAQA